MWGGGASTSTGVCVWGGVGACVWVGVHMWVCGGCDVKESLIDLSMTV